MSCQWCSYWVEQEQPNEERPFYDRLGDCAFNPTRVPKTGSDICGQFKWERLHMYMNDLPVVPTLYQRLDEARKDASDAERKLKAAREKYARLLARFKKLKGGDQ